MRLGPDARRWLCRAGLCHGLGGTGLSGMLLEARLLGPLADGLPVGFRISNRPAGRSPAGDWIYPYFPATKLVEALPMVCVVPSISMVRISPLAAATASFRSTMRID
jgi:hypothetical protein